MKMNTESEQAVPLQNKTAIVTGAARGIGRAIAIVLARQGADVAVADLKIGKWTGEPYYSLDGRVSGEEEDPGTCDVIRGLGRRSAGYEVDVADSAGVQKLFRSVVDEFGGVDILVNNAAVVVNFTPLARTKPEAWSREVRVNLDGAFHCIREAIPAMKKKGWGRIVNIASGVAATGGMRQGAYVASKAGLVGLTKATALEVARYGITCNCLLPGFTDTGLLRDRMPAEVLEEITEAIPCGRLAEAEEVGELVAFLCSDRAAYIQGAEIAIDGGIQLTPFVFPKKI